MYYARRRRGLGATEPDTFTGSTGATGPVTPPAPPRAIGPPSTYQYFPGVYTPAPRSTAGSGSTQIQFVETAPRAGVNVGPTPKLTVQIPPPGRVERPEAASIFTPVPTEVVPVSRFVPGSREQQERHRAERAEQQSIGMTYEEALEASAEATLHKGALAPYASSSAFRYGQKIWYLFSKGLTGQCVGGFCRSTAEKALSRALKPATADSPVEQKLVEHGLRIVTTTGPVARAETALAEKALSWVVRGGEAALKRAPSAGELVVGKVIGSVGVVALVAEGAWDLYRIQQATALWDQALRNAERQTDASARALSSAVMNNRSTWTDMSKLSSEIQSTERARRVNENEARLFSDTTLGPLSRQIDALEQNRGRLTRVQGSELFALRQEYADAQKKYDRLANSASYASEKLTDLMSDFARKNRDLLDAVGQSAIAAAKQGE